MKMKKYFSLEWVLDNFDLIIVWILSGYVIYLEFFSQTETKNVFAAILSVLVIVCVVTLRNRRIMNKLSTKIDSVNINQALSNSGIVNIAPNMRYDIFDDKIKNANTQIIILQTWLKALNPISENMIEAANRGVKIRILILDPECDMARQRSVELGLEWNTSRPKALFEGVQSAFKKNKIEDKIKVKTFEKIPPFSMYLVDDWISTGFYWHGRGSVSNPMLELNGIDKSKLGWYFIDTFEEIWKSGQDIIIDK